MIDNEKNTERYIGITIGPIYDTINLSSSPVGLWAASYLFSSITYRLCEKIAGENGISKEDIIVPYFDADENELDQIFKNGVGLYHDRIIVKSDSLELSTINKIISEVIADVSVTMNNDSDSKAFFEEYLQIYAISFDATSDANVILDMGKRLDAIELEKTFQMVQKKNDILDLIKTPDADALKYKGDNENVKKFARNILGENIKNWQLWLDFRNEKIKSLADISGLHSENGKNSQKKYSYYAIIQSDGDNITKVIEKYSGNTDKARVKIRDEFSKKLLKYSADAADMVEKFGGVTIYAGGDDLLAIAPLEKHDTCNEDFKKGDSFIKLLEALNNKFSVIWGEDSKEDKTSRPTLSFGVAICYYKYPLYEAFGEAAHMLFDEAKSEKKNSLAVSLQKHSGHAICFAVENFNSNSATSIIKDLIQKQSNDSEEYLNSVATNIAKYNILFSNALEIDLENNVENFNEATALKNIFENIFDSQSHITVKKEQDAQLNKVRELLYLIGQGKTRIRAFDSSDTLYALDAVLRFIKFYAEAGRE